MKQTRSKLIKRIAFGAISVGIISSTFFIRTIHGQSTTRTITIVPPVVEQQLDPGKTAEGTLKVINDSDEPLTFTATIRDFLVEDKVGTPTLLPPNSQSKKYSASAWIGVTPDSFTIAPHQKQLLNYYVQIPADARPGGRYAAVVYEPNKQGSVNGSGASVATQIGTLFYITVKGPVTLKATVPQFDAGAFHEYGPIYLISEILNSSDLHIRPKGTVTLKNMFGQVIESKAFPEKNIFPEQSRLYQMVFGEKWMFGRYTLSFYGTYGVNNNLPLTAMTSFWVIPWKVITVILLLITFTILLLVFLKTKKKKYEASTPEVKKEE